MSNKTAKGGLGKGLSGMKAFDVDTTAATSSLYRSPGKVKTAPNEPKVVASMAGDIAMIPIGHIERNADQPRTDFDDGSLKALASSIEELGIIQPITVRRLSALKYQIISGERRFRASQMAGLDKIPAYIRTANDQQLLEMGLVENVQREDLHPIEIASSYKRLCEECGLSHDEIGKLVGKSRSSVSNQLRLLELPEEIQLQLGEKNITQGHAKALLSLKGNKLKQIKVMNIIIAQNLSVREAEELCSKDSGRSKVSSKKSLTPLTGDEEQAIFDLKNRFSKTIKIKRMGNSGGRIELHYKNQEELLELLDKL